MTPSYSKLWEQLSIRKLKKQSLLIKKANSSKKELFYVQIIYEAPFPLLVFAAIYLFLY